MELLGFKDIILANDITIVAFSYQEGKEVFHKELTFKNKELAEEFLSNCSKECFNIETYNLNLENIISTKENLQRVLEDLK